MLSCKRVMIQSYNIKMTQSSSPMATSVWSNNSISERHRADIPAGYALQTLSLFELKCVIYSCWILSFD